MMSCRTCCRCWRINLFYVWISLAALVSMVVVVLALVSPTWLEGRYGEKDHLRMGLLEFCRQGDESCAPNLLVGKDGWGDAVRVAGVLAAVILFTLFVLGVLLHVLDDDLLYTLPLLILGLLSGTLGIISAIIFGIVWTTPESVMKDLSADFSWGYGVFVGGNAVTLTLFIVLCILGKDLRVSQVKPPFMRTR